MTGARQLPLAAADEAYSWPGSTDVRLPVNEVFGPTFQGEGPHTGRPCAFVRLGLCNLSCEWCDTPYTWDRTRFDLDVENPPTTVAEVGERLAATGCSLVVLTGGEPLVHHRLLPHLLELEYDWHVETNGTIAPPLWWTAKVEHTSVSPKVNTRDPLKKRIRHKALDAWTAIAHADRACFKFVASTERDLEVVDGLVQLHDMPRHAVWVMPEGTTTTEVIHHHRQLADAILARGYSTTTRLHTLLWNDERGH